MNKKTLSTIGLVAVIVLCVFRYVFFTFYTSHLDKVQNSCTDHIGSVAFNALADSLEYIATKIEVFEFVDIDDNLDNIPKREIVSQLSKFKNNFYYVSSVYLALENGQYYESSSQSSDLLTVENEAWYYKTRNDLKINFLTVMKNKTACALVTAPFYYKGEYAGVIAVEVDNALFKKTADFFGDDMVQLVISDEDDNPFFEYDKNFEDGRKYSKFEHTYNFMTHNMKELATFKTAVYSVKTGNKLEFYISTIVFSLIFAIFFGWMIITKWKNNKDFSAGLFALQVIVIMNLEILFCFWYYSYSYNSHIDHHKDVMEKYTTQLDSNAKYISDVIWLKAQEKKLFNENRLIELGSKEMEDIMDIYKSVSKNNSHIINLFFITKDGEYQNFPLNTNYSARDLNFQINRRLLNGSDRSTYTSSEDMGSWILEEFVYKFKDNRSNHSGTFGINLSYEVPENAIARYISDINDNYLEYRDGVITEIAEDGSKTIKEISLTKAQKEEIAANNYGIIKCKKGLTNSFYVYMTTLKGETKRLVELKLEGDDSPIRLFIVCLILSIVGILLSIFLAIKEKKDEVTYENVEDEYEVDLIKKEDNYFKMIENDEEIQKGLRVMKIFGKKPSETFAKKLKEYKKRMDERKKF